MMIHPYVEAALARERSATLQLWAAAARQARQARLAGSTPATQPVRLRDGSRVLIRPVRPADAALLADGFARLSERSRRMRFLSIKNTLTEADLRYYTDIDHHDHEALGALDHARGGGVGIARYVRDREDPQAAEIAVTIVDDWQGRGLGAELVDRLSERARQEGICRFTAMVAADNAPMAGLLRRCQADLTGRGYGTLEYEIALSSPRRSGR
jgi:RimJ/RimL family protein N-acetyltransferase